MRPGAVPAVADLPPRPPVSPPARTTRRAVLFDALLAVPIVLTAVWGVLALAYAGPRNDWLRAFIVVAFAVAALLCIVLLTIAPRWRRRARVAYLVLFASLLAWWHGIQPSNERQWQPDVAQLASVEIDGDLVTVHNIRDFEYRSETDFTPRYHDRHFDLRAIEGVDLVAVYWMGPAIAHIFLSFAFEGGEHLAFSIETRKEQGEAYSTLKGFFRQYELYYVVADERDVIGLRTNHRHDPPEDVYVYRVRAPSENARRLFRQYAARINGLREQPEFYNTLTTNCTTVVWQNTVDNAERLPFSWKILASGYVPEYLFETGRLDTTVTFAELQRQAHVNARGQAAGAGEDFSRRIREKLAD
jgi:hypothetical protein